ncbi:MAG: serine/threonine protein kinase [Anaerolineae bacterium]|nr:serine/threonine protein kinase [Anaerolineae bacterium]
MTFQRITHKGMLDTTFRTGGMLAFYQLLEKIGQGGEAEVWSAWDTQSECVVAVKIVRNTSSAFSYISSMQFLKEAQIIKRLRHPNVVQLYDFGEMSGLRFLVSRYMIGGSLAMRLKSGPLPIAEFATIATVLATTLDYLHVNAIVHRDLKPGNVLLDAKQVPYLTDFGLAREIPMGSTIPMHTPEGTLPYMSPEQFRGEQLSFRSDLYSFGVMMFEMLTGELPLGGQIMLALHQQNTNESIPDPRSVNPSLPSGLHPIFAQLTSARPIQRPENATSAIHALLTALALAQPVEVPNTLAFSEMSVQDYEQFIQQSDSLAWLSQIANQWTPSLPFPLTLTDYMYSSFAAVKAAPISVTNHPRELDVLVFGALRYRSVQPEQIDRWWASMEPNAQRELCWASLRQTHNDDPYDALVSLLTMIMRLVPTAPLPPDIAARLEEFVRLNRSPLSETALKVLLHWFPASPITDWNTTTNSLDNLLAATAASNSPLGLVALHAISSRRSVPAIRILIASAAPPQKTALLADVWRQAGSLPTELPLALRLRTAFYIGRDQLFKRWGSLLVNFACISLGCIGGITLVVHSTFRNLDFFLPRRILTSLGNGLVFGLQIGLGGFVAWWIAERLAILKPWWRGILATVLGGVLVAQAFSNMHRQFLDIPPVSPLLLPGGLVFAAGYTLTGLLRNWRWRAFFIFLSISLALLGTWEIALNSQLTLDVPYDPLIYLADDSATAYVLALAFAAFAALCMLLPQLARITQLRNKAKAILEQTLKSASDSNFPKT